MIENTNNAPGAPGTRLWHSRDFNIFWVGQTLSNLGDAFALLALPLLVLQITGSVAQMGLVTGASGGGQLLAGLFAGAIVDRVDRRRLMIVCDIGRALLYATIPLGWWLVGPQIWLIYVVAVAGAALGMGFQVAYIAAVANLVDRDQIADANGRLQATLALAMVVGPVLAGFVSDRFGPTTAIGVDALSFLVSAVSLMPIRLRQSFTARSPQDRTARQAVNLEELLAGVRFLLREPVLRSVTLLFFMFTLVAAGGFDLFIYYLKHDLGQPDRTVGVVFGIACIGAAFGALLGPLLRRRWGFGICFLGSMVLEGIAIITIGLAPSLAFITALATVMTFANVIQSINSMTVRQQVTPDHLLGRVTAAFWTLLRIPRPIGAAFTTGLAAWTGVRVVFVVIGTLGIVIALIGLLTPVRAHQPEAQVGPIADTIIAP